MLNLKNFSKTMHGKKIIDNVSLQIKHGEVAVLLGSSGVGKSTLLRILNNLETFDSGTVELDGSVLDISTIHDNHLAGFVFQHFNLFEHLTVEHNITLPLEQVALKTKQEAHSIAMQLLEQYGLADKNNAIISQLSGGEKQRLALARTLALKPKIVCLDEPTSALDPQLTTQVAREINDLATQGYILLLATHDTALLSKMGCTIHLMEKGSIVESAVSADFFAHKDRYPKIAAFIN